MPTKEEIRLLAESDLVSFIKLVSPSRMLGSCHREVIDWWERDNAKSHQLLLFPRDHMKSALVAFRVAWYLAKDPTLRILYVSSTANLAEKQLGFIKSIFESPTFQKYWPDHIVPDEGRREKWTSTEIALDHPRRKEEHIRDPSIFTAGLTTNLVGMHCDIAVLDDVVTGDNALTKEGRDKVKRQYSLLSSIEGAEAKEWVVGTRYHPKDLYGEMMDMVQEIYNEKGNLVGEEAVYEVMQRELEDIGDGSGEYLWPRTKNPVNGKYYGFDIQIYAKKKAQYLDKTQFRAQYYNNPNDPDSAPIDYRKFQYYDKGLVKRDGGSWYYKGRKLNICAAIDFAFSTRQRGDFTCLVVAGVDSDNNYYVLDIDRFKTPHISDYFDRILAAYNRWGFRKIVMEVTAAQEAIVKSLKQDYVQPNGLFLKVEEVRPTRNEGTKEERVDAILTPRYENSQMWHYRGGNCQELEEELVSSKPPHDDIKDTLAMCIVGLVKPMDRRVNRKEDNNVLYHPRFGGRSF